MKRQSNRRQMKNNAGITVPGKSIDTGNYGFNPFFYYLSNLEKGKKKKDGR